MTYPYSRSCSDSEGQLTTCLDLRVQLVCEFRRLHLGSPSAGFFSSLESEALCFVIFLAAGSGMRLPQMESKKHLYVYND